VASKKRETENVLHGNAIMSASYWPAEHSVRSFVYVASFSTSCCQPPPTSASLSI